MEIKLNNQSDEAPRAALTTQAPVETPAAKTPLPSKYSDDPYFISDEEEAAMEAERARELNEQADASDKVDAIIEAQKFWRLVAPSGPGYPLNDELRKFARAVLATQAPAEPHPCEEAAREGLVDELEGMRVAFDPASDWHDITGRAINWIKGELAAPTPAPGRHIDGSDRFKVVRGSYWWSVRIGDGQQTVGKFHTEKAAEDLAFQLLRAFRDGHFAAALAVEPGNPANQAEPGRVMMSAHALCPTDMPHPKRMQWMADYFLKNVAPPAGAQGGEAPADAALKAFAEFVDKELDGRAPIWLWLARFKTANPDVHSITTATKAPGAAGEGAGSGSGQ